MKLKNAGLIIFFGLIWLFLGNGLSWAAEPKSSLKLSIVLEKKEYKADEPLNVTFKLENKGKTPVYVNKRFYLAAEELSPKKGRDLYLNITAPSGAKLVSKFNYETGLPKSDYFVLLSPGGEVSSGMEEGLAGAFDFKESGTYKATAVYENSFGAELGLDTFRKKISSEPVTFKVLKADPKK